MGHTARLLGLRQKQIQGRQEPQPPTGLSLEHNPWGRAAGTLTMSLPDSEDTEDADEPEESSWGLDRDKVRRSL